MYLPERLEKIAQLSEADPLEYSKHLYGLTSGARREALGWYRFGIEYHPCDGDRYVVLQHFIDSFRDTLLPSEEVPYLASKPIAHGLRLAAEKLTSLRDVETTANEDDY